MRVDSVRRLLASAADEPQDLEDTAWAATRAAMESELAERFS
ncbi:hypothetical protein FM114_14095 [Luteococcus japonicus LSP_Lj1]|uniref:Uncharacterized protein n=1 Tax=Luteococcus japonicus LSP_Lj1 TaxID=1255658 RepID=A0A1R4KFY0_9ACTN|nr:hypothetical protein FM114_14095 [Luteococcus japonicus LSP_Lj1]